MLVALIAVVVLAAGCVSEEPLQSVADEDGQVLEPDDAAAICLGEEDGTFEYVVGYEVVDGDLGDACFGETNDELVDAWQVLVDIVPQGQRRDLVSFTGFRQDAGQNDGTLAFVAAADESGSIFEMSVNVDQTGDLDELHLTLAHEFSHVFTAIPTELDRSIGEDDCDTYWNGEGCYEPGSVLAEWVELFWADKLEDFDPTADEASNGYDERCSLDSGFLGSYAATSPEEDFAESFAAYVMRVPDQTDGHADRFEWIDSQPGLREFRDRAVAAGYGPQAHNFEACG